MKMGKNVTIRTSPELTGYLGIPNTEGPFPVVLVFMHRPGVDKPMMKVVDDLVEAGFAALCWDSYRGGELRESYTDATVFEDFEASLQYIQHLPECNFERLGTLGFCMGGRHVYLAATRYNQKLKAAVSFYGFPTRGTDEKDTPIHLVGSMTVPVLGIFGKEDHLMSFDDVLQFKERLLAQSPTNSEHRIIVYDDVGHGFLDPFSKRYKDGVSAGKAWSETVTFFKKRV